MKINETAFPIKLACSSIALLALTACGGSSSNDPAVDDGFYSAIDEGTVQTALDNGRTISAKHGSFLVRDFENGTSTLSDATVAIRKTDDGNLAMIIDGEEFIFTVDEQDFPDGYRFETIDSDEYGLYAFDGPITDSLDTNSRSFANVYLLSYYSDSDDSELGGMFVIGTETELAQLDLLTGASYRGFMNARFWAEDSALFEDAVRVRGDMEMTANFTGGTISGSTVDGELRLEDNVGPDEDIAGRLFFETALIDGTSYGGDISVDGNFLASTGLGAVTGEYEGSFFGPFADETAGVITGTTVDGYVLTGQFNARADVD